jgi:hypothetical protein
VLLLILVISGGTRYVVGPVFQAVSALYLAAVRFLL